MNGRIDKVLRDDLFIIKRYTATTGKVVAAGASYSWTVGYMGYAEPSGYTPVGVSYIAMNSAQLGLCYFTTSSTGTYGIASRNGSNASTSSSSPCKPAIDIIYAPTELVEIVDTANNETDTTFKPFKNIRFAHSYTLANTATAKITPAQLGFYVPTGYQIFSMTAGGSGNNKVLLITADPFNTSHIIQLRNASGGSVSTTASINVTFIRNDFAEQILANP